MNGNQVAWSSSKRSLRPDVVVLMNNKHDVLLLSDKDDYVVTPLCKLRDKLSRSSKVIFCCKLSITSDRNSNPAV